MPIESPDLDDLTYAEIVERQAPGAIVAFKLSSQPRRYNQIGLH